MTIITSLISLFTKTPSRLNPSTFSSDMDTRLSEENSRITQMNDMSTQMNAVAQEINQKAVAIYNQAITGGYSQAYIDRSQLTPYAELTASGGETLFIVADNSDVIVYKNSIELLLTTDYTINVDGITIDFVNPLSTSDFIQVFDATKLDSRIDTKLNINSYTSKTTPVDADEILISDSATSYSLKKLTFANLKATVISSFGAMINTLTSKTTLVSADEFIIGDSADSNSSKKLTFGSLLTTLSSTFAPLISPAFTGTPTLNSEPLFVSNTISITGTFTATNVTNNINLTGVGSLSGLTVGDVIKISGTTTAQNDGYFTVEVITDANNIIVNEAHKGKSRTVAPIGEKALIDEISTANVTISIFDKWYNASEGLGQGWVDVTAERTVTTVYSNLSGRTIKVKIFINAANGDHYITNNASRIDQINRAVSYLNTLSADISDSTTYFLTAPIAPVFWKEKR